MSAVPKTVKPLPLPATGNAPGRTTRRPGASTTGQTSDVRRRLQRDLDRREASLRINRRVSGPVGGVSRPASAPQLPLSSPATGPVQRAANPATPAQPAVRPAAPARREPAPQAAPAPPSWTQPATAAARATRPATAFAAAAAPAVAAPLPLPALPRSPLIKIDGGRAAAGQGKKRRLSVPAVLLSAAVMFVLTIGVIVALQIQMTQVNEQLGADLAQVSRHEQAVTQLREQISRQVAGAQIAGEVSRRGLVEPDVADVRYLKAGDRAATAQRAADALAHAPVAGAAAAQAADAAAAPVTPVSITGTAAATAGAVGAP